MSEAWVWIATFTVLGSTPEHGTVGGFATKYECQRSLEQRRLEYRNRGKELVGTCFYTTRNSGTR